MKAIELKSQSGSQLALIGALVASAIILGRSIAMQSWMIVGAIALIPMLLLWPVEVALGMFAFSVPFSGFVLSSGSGVSFAWITGALAGMVVLGVGVAFRRMVVPPAPAVWWSLFAAWGLLSIAWAIDPEKTIHRLPTSLSLVVLFVSTAALKASKREFRVAVIATIAGGVVAAALSARTFYTLAGSSDAEHVRGSLALADDTETDPNVFAASLLLPLSLAIGESLSAITLRRRILMWGSTAAIAAGILLSMSRGGFLAVVVLLAVYAYRLRLRWKVLWPIAMVAALLLSMPQFFFSRLAQALPSGGAGRLYIWKAGFEALKHYPLWGAGLDNFQMAYRPYSGYAPRFYGYFRAAHNIYLQTAVELGILGFTLMLASVASHFRQIQRLRKEKGNLIALRLVPYEAAGCALLAAGFFLDIVWQKLFWLVWILAVIAVQVTRNTPALVASPAEDRADYSQISA